MPAGALVLLVAAMLCFSVGLGASRRVPPRRKLAVAGFTCCGVLFVVALLQG